MCKGVIFDFNRTIYDPQNASLMKGATDLLDFFRDKGLVMSLLSKANQPGREEEIKNLGIETYFVDTIVTYGKKKPAHFRHLLEAMKTEPSETIVIGDRVKSEIHLGNELGMRTIWLRKGKFKEEWPDQKSEEPDFVVKSLEEILQNPGKYLNC